MAEEWVPAARVQKNDAGEFRAEINGQWVPAARAQKSADGQYRVMLPAAPAEEKSGFMQGLGNLAAGAVRGAGSIGATLLTPVDAAARAMGVQNDFIGRNDRRTQMDAGLQSMGAQPDSLMYQGGKIGAEIAGTAGAGGALANGARAVLPAAAQALPAVAKGINALSSGGLSLGAPAATTALGRAGDMALRVGGGAALGGASAGLVNPNDAGTGAVIGGAIPVAAKAIGAGAQAAGNALRGGGVSPEVANLAQRANALGIDVPADRLVNSKPMNAIASALNYVPFSGRAGTEATMQSQMNKALSRTLGQNTDNVGDAIKKASTTLGSEFDRVLQNNAVKVDQQFVQDMSGTAQKALKELESGQASIILKQIKEIRSLQNNGQLDGQAAYNIKKTLDRIGNRNTPEAYYARDLKKSLMGALDRSLGPQEAQAFAKTREQYGNMLTLENLAQNGADGNVSIARIANLKNINSPELQEVADIAAQFLKPREGQHGAAQRAATAVIGAGMGGIPAVASGAVLGRGTNMLLNSNALRNSMLGQTNPALGNALENIPRIAQRVAPVLSAQ